MNPKDRYFKGKVVNGDALQIKTGKVVTEVHLASIRPLRIENEDPSQRNRQKGFRPLYDIPFMFEVRHFYYRWFVGKSSSTPEKLHKFSFSSFFIQVFTTFLVVRFILEVGANVEVHNENSHTPLMEAASARHCGVTKILLEFGEGINTHKKRVKGT